MVVWALLVAASGTAGAAEAGGPDAVHADRVAYGYDDGNLLVMLEEARLDRSGEIRIFDLSGAPPEVRERVRWDLEAGRYDGVFLGPGAAGGDEGDACGSISRCARSITQVCRWFGASGTSASIQGGCQGSCSDGAMVTVLCAP